LLREFHEAIEQTLHNYVERRKGKRSSGNDRHELKQHLALVFSREDADFQQINYCARLASENPTKNLLPREEGDNRDAISTLKFRADVECAPAWRP
jgi:hypothetical protein